MLPKEAHNCPMPPDQGTSPFPKAACPNLELFLLCFSLKALKAVSTNLLGKELRVGGSLMEEVLIHSFSYSSVLAT